MFLCNRFEESSRIKIGRVATLFLYTHARNSRAKTRIICGHDYATLLREVAAPHRASFRVECFRLGIQYTSARYTANSYRALATRFASYRSPRATINRRAVPEALATGGVYLFFPPPPLFSLKISLQTLGKKLGGKEACTPRAIRTRDVDTTRARGF